MVGFVCASSLFRIRARFSVKIAGGEVLLVPAEIMAELVQVSDAHLGEEGIPVLFHKIPYVIQIKADLRRHWLLLGDFLTVGGAVEEAEDVLGETFLDDVGGWP